jgi:hypothetical protein
VTNLVDASIQVTIQVTKCLNGTNSQIINFFWKLVTHKNYLSEGTSGPSISIDFFSSYHNNPK